MPKHVPPDSTEASIDLSFRPASYFWPLSLEKHLLGTVKGAERRGAIRRLLASTRRGDVDGPLTAAALTDAERSAIGRIHPSLMGGEYLPNQQKLEVEIARITIASVTQDVTSVYARRSRNRIHYRVVDEYGGETLGGRSTRTSIRPLTLGELVRFFDQAWSLFGVLGMNFGGGGIDLARVQRFVIGVESQFYPQISQLYTRRIEAWWLEQHGKDEPGS